MAKRKPKPKPADPVESVAPLPPPADDAYARHRERAAERGRRQARAGQDIGPPPDPVNPARRAEGWGSLRRFCEIYFAQRFNLAWSADHLAVIARMEEAIVNGGLFALAMMRGGGKTSLSEVACLWAVLTGRHRFVMLIAVSMKRATQLLDSIKTELLTNDLLHEDFPEVTHAIRALDDRANRSKGQHIDGQKTYIGWRKDEIVLPTVAGSVASGAVLRVAGMTSGSIRGPKYTQPGGGQIRPSLAVLDDPQDDKSARSPAQCDHRHRLIHGAVLGMAGPGKTMTALCPCTIIAPGDLADRLLDRQQSPLWTGQRYALLVTFPERLDLWDDYGVRRADEFRNGGDGSQATAFYLEHREAMDAGAVVSWDGFRKDGDASALQSAMNLYYLDRAAFFAEWQNAPLDESLGSGDQLRAVELVKRLSGHKRGAAPLATQHVTAYVDVQGKCLYYVVAAWASDFTGTVLDYGTYPDQGRRYFTLEDAQKTLARAAPGAGLEGSIRAGLSALVPALLSRDWRREDGVAMKVSKLLIDANWGSSTDTVFEWCRSSPYGELILPSHGRGVGPSNKPWTEYQSRPGQRLGFHWLITAAASKRATRYLLIDTNFWKSFVAERLLTAPGDKGALTFYGGGAAGGSPDHRMIADHCCSEWRDRLRHEASGRVVDVWHERPGKPDNHLWDCLVGSAVAASILGASLPGTEGGAMGGKRTERWSEIQRRKREGAAPPAKPKATEEVKPEAKPAPAAESKPAAKEEATPEAAAPAPAVIPAPQPATRKSWKQIQEEKRRERRRGA